MCACVHWYEREHTYSTEDLQRSEDSFESWCLSFTWRGGLLLIFSGDSRPGGPRASSGLLFPLLQLQRWWGSRYTLPCLAFLGSGALNSGPQGCTQQELGNGVPWSIVKRLLTEIHRWKTPLEHVTIWIWWLRTCLYLFNSFCFPARLQSGRHDGEQSRCSFYPQGRKSALEPSHQAEYP